MTIPLVPNFGSSVPSPSSRATCNASFPSLAVRMILPSAPTIMVRASVIGILAIPFLPKVLSTFPLAVSRTISRRPEPSSRSRSRILSSGVVAIRSIFESPRGLPMTVALPRNPAIARPIGGVAPGNSQPLLPWVETTPRPASDRRTVRGVVNDQRAGWKFIRPDARARAIGEIE